MDLRARNVKTKKDEEFDIYGRKLFIQLSMSVESMRCSYKTPAQLLLVPQEQTPRTVFVPVSSISIGLPESPKQVPCALASGQRVT